MNVGKLQRALASIRGMFEAAGAKAPAQDVACLEELTSGHENEEIDGFLHDLRQDLLPLSPDAVVGFHVNKLRGAGSNEAMFREAIDAISKDKLIKKPEADRIAHAYIGGRTSWGSRKAALEAIEKEFIALRYNESKMKEVARSRPW